MAVQTAGRAGVPAPQNATRLIRVALTQTDFEALDAVGRKYGHRAASAALRFCVIQQDLRDSAFGSGGVLPRDREAAARAAERLVGGADAEECLSLAAAARLTVGNALQRSQQFGGADSSNRQWSLWMYGDDLDAASRVAYRWGLNSRVDAIRLAIRVQAGIAGFRPPAGVWS